MLVFLRCLGQVLALVVLVLQPSGGLEVQCPIPDIAHGQLKSAQNFTIGSTATLECDTGYTPLGASTVRNGRWQPGVPACVLGHCPSPPVVDHADRNAQREFPVGTVVSYFCRSGYMLLPDVSPITTCLTNFTWSAVPKLCQQVQCSSPVIPHGRETTPRKANYTYGKHVEFRCDPGYVLRGSQRTQCWSDGTWRPPMPYCDKVCGPPPKIINGQHSALRTEQFPYGSEVKSLIGDESVYCTSNNGVDLVWSGPAPECRVVRCPKPTVERGRMTPQTFTFSYGSAVRFSCDKGFVLRGDAESRCQADGTWHPPLPSCQPVLCPRPQVANGRLNSALGSKMQYQTNATVTFECLEGYHFSEDEDVSLEDSWTATCLPDGSWTPLPKCKKEGDADVCEEVHSIETVFDCGVPLAEVKTLLEIQKLFLEIKKLKMEL
ncbi:Zona pellucida sperm-binding protein 3 receptor, partial [Buceros rhinoceros silvestris]